MKDGITYLEYINFLNHLFMQQLVDFDYYENANNGSTQDAFTVIGD